MNGDSTDISASNVPGPASVKVLSQLTVNRTEARTVKVCALYLTIGSG